jgi:predicted PurR-regulated permease PerM
VDNPVDDAADNAEHNAADRIETPQERVQPMRPDRALQLGLWVALAALAVLALPFTAPLVLAAWLAAALRPWLARLARRLGGRHRAAAVLTLLFFLVLMAPLTFIGVSLGVDAVQLAGSLASSDSGRDALADLVSSDDTTGLSFDPSAVAGMVERYGARALELAGSVAGTLAELTLGVFVFLSAAYVLLVDGPRAWAWTRAHAPVDPAGLERLRLAFHETGRGLFVGIGLTGLLQAGVATVAYLALGIPRALVLGLVTLFASILPTVGTALVWVPVCIGLLVTGRTTAALILAIVGVVVVSAIDNVLRPVLSRFGHLSLPSLVLLIAMLGGLSILGTSGLFLGPLIARLAVEVVRMARDRGMVGESAAATTEPPSTKTG